MRTFNIVAFVMLFVLGYLLALGVMAAVGLLPVKTGAIGSWPALVSGLIFASTPFFIRTEKLEG